MSQPVRIHARHQRALRAVYNQTPRVTTNGVAAELHLDYDQTLSLLQDLDAAGHVRRDDLGHWAPTPTNATTPEKP